MSGMDPQTLQAISAGSKVLSGLAPLLFPVTQRQGFGPGPTVTRSGAISGALPGVFNAIGEASGGLADIREKGMGITNQDWINAYTQSKGLNQIKLPDTFAKQKFTNASELAPFIPEMKKEFKSEEVPGRKGESVLTYDGKIVPPGDIITPPPTGDITLKTLPNGAQVYTDQAGNIVDPKKMFNVPQGPPTEYDKLELQKIQSEIDKNKAYISKLNSSPQGKQAGKSIGLDQDMTDLMNQYFANKPLNPRQRLVLSAWMDKKLEFHPKDLDDPSQANNPDTLKQKQSVMSKMVDLLMTVIRPVTGTFQPPSKEKGKKTPSKPELKTEPESEDSGSTNDWVFDPEKGLVPAGQ